MLVTINDRIKLELRTGLADHMNRDLVSQVVAELQKHLQSAELVHLGENRFFRRPTSPIKCADGVEFSVQASEFTYCTPRNNTGPWTEVEVMTLTADAVPHFWAHDDQHIAAYVPIEAVACEIIKRANHRLTIQ